MKRIPKSEFGLCDFVNQQFCAYGWVLYYYSQHLLLNLVKYIIVQTVLPHMYFVVIFLVILNKFSNSKCFH